MILDVSEIEQKSFKNLDNESEAKAHCPLHNAGPPGNAVVTEHPFEIAFCTQLEQAKDT